MQCGARAAQPHLLFLARSLLHTCRFLEGEQYHFHSISRLVPSSAPGITSGEGMMSRHLEKKQGERKKKWHPGSGDPRDG